MIEINFGGTNKSYLNYVRLWLSKEDTEEKARSCYTFEQLANWLQVSIRGHDIAELLDSSIFQRWTD